MQGNTTVSKLLGKLKKGDSNAASELWNAVYQEVRQMAAGKLSKERQTANLQATMLVNEAYLKMLPKGNKHLNFDNRGHFFSSISRAMEQCLIDYARARGRLKRGGNRKRVPLEIAVGELKDLTTVNSEALEDMLAALGKLTNIMPRAAEVVRLRYISGLTIKQTSEALEVSARTIVEDWEYAKAFLLREITTAVHYD